MKYDYKDMLEQAQKNGVSGEKIMWQSVDSLNALLVVVKREHPQMYWDFIREQHGIMYNNHYTEDFAEYDVSQLEYTDKQGNRKSGGYWTMEQIEQATSQMKFPSGTTKWDKYVAFNVAYSDFCKKFDDAQILDIAFSFFFADDDWGSTAKVWEYMRCKNKKGS